MTTDAETVWGEDVETFSPHLVESTDVNLYVQKLVGSVPPFVLRGGKRGLAEG